MKKHLLSITLLLTPAAFFAMEKHNNNIVQDLVKAAPVAGSKKTVLGAPAKEEASVVEQLADQQTAPTEEEKDKEEEEKVEATYRRGVLGSLGLKVAGYDRTGYVISYYRCDKRCQEPCEHQITIPANMIDQLSSDRNRAIMTEQTEAIKNLQAKRNDTIPSKHDVQKNIHEGPVQKIGTIVRNSKRSVNFKLNDVRSIKRVDTLLRNEDAADLELLADVYDMVQKRMKERKETRGDLYAQKPEESQIVYSDTEYGDDEQFVEKLQSYRKAKKALQTKK